MAENTRKGRAAKPSITSHPLFPVIVVLWFGALFGLASLAIRPALLESLVAATGIDRLVPMAAPPLGHTARGLIVLLMTIVGCLVGFVLARRIVTPAAQSVVRRRSRGNPQSVITDASAAEMCDAADLADDEVPQHAASEDEEPEQPLRRRRQLALLPDEPVLEEHAAVPGAQILSVSELPLKSFDEVDGIWLHSSDRAEPRVSTVTPSCDDAPGSHTVTPELTPIAQPSAPIDHTDAIQSGSDDRSNRLFESYVRRVSSGVGSNDSDDEPTPGFVSLSANIPQQPAEAEPTLSDEPPLSAPGYINTAERIATAPLDALSHVELLERLAQTIARRRAQAARSTRDQADTAVSAPAVQEGAGSAAHESPPPSVVPNALRPHWLDVDLEKDDASPAPIPSRTIAMAPPADDAILADGYSSLRGMTREDARQPIRAFEDPEAAASTPPILSFPGAQEATAPTEPPRRVFDAPPATPAADQTEQALRAALATLRRMSGAA